MCPNIWCRYVTNTTGRHMNAPPSATDSPFKLPTYVAPLAARIQCRAQSMPTIKSTSTHSDSITMLTKGIRGILISASIDIMVRCENDTFRDFLMLLPADRACISAIHILLTRGIILYRAFYGNSVTVIAVPQASLHKAARAGHQPSRWQAEEVLKGTCVARWCNTLGIVYPTRIHIKMQQKHLDVGN